MVHHKNPIKVGDIAIIHVNGVSRGRWPLGTVISINQGADGQVRSATVQTIGGTFERGVAKLCVLPAGTRLDEEGRPESPFFKNKVQFRRKKVAVLQGERGKTKTVQKTRTAAAPRPSLKRLRLATLDVSCGSGGLGQLRPNRTRATTTGLIHQAVARATRGRHLATRRMTPDCEVVQRAKFL